MSAQSFARFEQPLTASDPRQNQLLAGLPASDYARLQPELEFAPLPLGRVIYAPGVECGFVYFPTSGLVSLRSVTVSGSSTEIATAGREGLVGAAAFLGGRTTPFRALVQSAGCAYRLEVSVLIREFEQSAALQSLALRHTLAFIAEMGQTAVCNRFHSMEQQVSRLILWRLDRLDSNELTMTHQSIAGNLGVRRESVTHAAGRLHATGLIDYQRGHISVLDRAGLESRACECYRVVKAQYGRLRPLASLGAGRAREPRLPLARGRAPARPAESMACCL